jgi:hypothetical protein
MELSIEKQAKIEFLQKIDGFYAHVVIGIPWITYPP